MLVAVVLDDLEDHKEQGYTAEKDQYADPAAGHVVVQIEASFVEYVQCTVVKPPTTHHDSSLFFFRFWQYYVASVS